MRIGCTSSGYHLAFYNKIQEVNTVFIKVLLMVPRIKKTPVHWLDSEGQRDNGEVNYAVHNGT